MVCFSHTHIWEVQSKGMWHRHLHTKLAALSTHCLFEVSLPCRYQGRVRREGWGGREEVSRCRLCLLWVCTCFWYLFHILNFVFLQFLFKHVDSVTKAMIIDLDAHQVNSLNTYGMQLCSILIHVILFQKQPLHYCISPQHFL